MSRSDGKQAVDVGRVDVPTPVRVSSEALEALRFGPRVWTRLAEAQIADSDVDQELQAAPDGCASADPLLMRRSGEVGDGHLQYVMDGTAGQLQPRPYRLPAHLAVETDVVEERSSTFRKPRPLLRANP